MTQIPIYRAKKIDSDEFVEGYLIQSGYNYYIVPDLRYVFHWDMAISIDPLTLAIHFPNMIDKNGRKIFAALNESGIGGDIILFDYGQKDTINFNNKYNGFFINGVEENMSDVELYLYEVIGIHKG